ncbi:sensor histidine kinase, partial [Terriglobus sp. YAF25]
LTVDSVASIISSSLERVRALRNEVTAQSERLSEQLRTSVLDGLAHAFKTPLTTISVASAGLAEVAELPEEQRGELLGLIRKEAERLNLITEQVLRTARLEWDKVLTLTCVNLRVLLEETISVLGERAAGKIGIVQQTERMTIEADRAVLKIAFEQILENALKYGDPGVRVTVLVAVQGSTATISIHNHGSYISPKEQQLVFTKFYRSPTVVHRANGTGIGLSVAQHAVTAHGGTITIRSDKGEGTTFVITLPITEEEGES